MKYNVHPAAEAFPMVSQQELRELADDIRENGLREPLWLFRDPDQGEVLLDGRNRVAACELAGVEPDTRYYDGNDPVAFIISQNVHRRHMSAGQKASAASKLKPYFDEKAKENKGGRPRKDEKPTADRREVSEPKHKRTAASRAAESVGATGRAVERYERVKREAPELAQKIDSGEMALDRAERIVRDRAAEARRIESAKAEAEAKEAGCTIDLRFGDFRDVLADIGPVDAIITDPPYPKEFLPLLDDLAAFADSVLTPDGILVVLIGQTYLPEVFQRLSGGRPYRWTGCYYTPRAGYCSHKAKVQCNWKPLLVYGGGPRFGDVITSEGSNEDAKETHKWGQDYGAFHTIVQRMTEPGQTVVDPFAGGGTTLLAAHALGRHAIGAECDQEAFDAAKRRLS